jgi:hypothetical protein
MMCTALGSLLHGAAGSVSVPSPHDGNFASVKVPVPLAGFVDPGVALGVSSIQGKPWGWSLCGEMC